MKLLAFDLETATLLPEDTRPDPATMDLGISCAAAVMDTGADMHVARAWHGYLDDDVPAPRMSREEVWDMMAWLHKTSTLDDYVILTWNGSFDWQVIGREIGDMQWAAMMCRRNVDLMLAFHRVRGHFLSLKSAAAACESHKGAADIESGEYAPDLWAKGEYERVLEYVTQDALATLEVARYMLANRGFEWTSKKGNKRQFELPEGITTIEDMMVCKLFAWDDPDQSWMNEPTTLQELLEWTRDAFRPG